MGCTLDFEAQFAGDDGAGGGSGGSLFGGGAPGGSGTGGTVLVGEVLRFGEHSSADIGDVSVDTRLHASSSDLNYGVSSTLQVRAGSAVSLLRFDVTALPLDATGAELGLHVPKKLASGDAVEIYEVLEAWDEGEVSGELGSANWVKRNDLEFWDSEGVGPGSRGSEPLATFTPSQDRHTYHIEIPTELVRAWQNDPDENFGIVLVGVADDPDDPDGVTFESSENSSTSVRPFLDVSY